MSYASPSVNSGFNASESSYFVWALLLSLALHALALMAMHPIDSPAEKLESVLDVVLAPPPKPPAPPPEPPPPPQKPVTPPPVKVATPPPLPVTPAPALPKEVRTEPPPKVEPPPQVISAPPRAVEPPTFTAPPPEPPKPVVTQDTDAARGAYANVLGREFAKHKQYPRLAQMRGWQGTVTVQLQIDASGAVTSSSISQSSGFEVLDKQALEMVKKASPLPQPPDALRDREFTVHVPVVFRLE